MKHIRKRAITKSMKINAITLLNKLYHHETALITAGVRVYSDEDEMTILNTLSSYAGILDASFEKHDDVFNEDWARYVMDHLE